MKRETLQFHLSEAVRVRQLTGAYLTMGPLNNQDAHAEFEALRAQILREVLPGLTSEELDRDSVLHGFRVLHEAFGVPNRKNPSAPEALLRHLLKTGDMPRINLVVDIYNLVSIKTHLALGAHDIAPLSGDIALRVTDGTEGFWPIGAQEQKGVAAGEYAYIDMGDNEVICRLEVRQVEKTKVTTNTTDCFFIVQGNARTSASLVQEATELLIAWTSKFCGGEARMLYKPW